MKNLLMLYPISILIIDKDDLIIDKDEIIAIEDNSELAKYLGWNGLINIGLNRNGNIVKYKKD